MNSENTEERSLGFKVYGRWLSGKPAEWDRTGKKLQVLYCCQAIEETGRALPFTAKLSKELIGQALSVKNFTTHLRERLRNQINQEFAGMDVNYCFVIEGHSSNMDWNGRGWSKGAKCDPHIHGLLSLPECPNAQERMRATISRAWAKTCQSSVTRPVVFDRKRKFDDIPSRIYWYRYLSKFMELSDLVCTGKGWAADNATRRRAKEMYTEERKLIIDAMAA